MSQFEIDNYDGASGNFWTAWNRVLLGKDDLDEALEYGNFDALIEERRPLGWKALYVI